MGKSKKDVTPLLTHRSYVFRALTYQHYVHQLSWWNEQNYGSNTEWQQSAQNQGSFCICARPMRDNVPSHWLGPYTKWCLQTEIFIQSILCAWKIISAMCPWILWADVIHSPMQPLLTTVPGWTKPCGQQNSEMSRGRESWLENRGISSYWVDPHVYFGSKWGENKTVPKNTRILNIFKINNSGLIYQYLWVLSKGSKRFLLAP